ncbi:hypothetical protein Tco_0612419 [Tanacetum coccineum]
MDSQNYKDGQSMQRQPLFEANCFVYWKNRFETYVKSKDIDLWHIIVYSDYKPAIRNKDTALPTKWRPKVTAIEESKNLSTQPLDELIGNLKVYKVVLKKNSEASKIKKEKYKSLALKERKVSSDEEESCSGCDEEYAMAVRDFKKFFRRRGKFVCQPYNNKKNIRKVKDEKKGKEERIESEEEDDFKKDEICLMALDNNEVLSDSLYYGKLGQESGKMPTAEPADLVASAREPISLEVANRPSAEELLGIKRAGYEL